MDKDKEVSAGKDQANTQLIQSLQRALDQELRAVVLYRMLGDRQPDEKRRNLFYRLADSEKHHADKFNERIIALGGTPSHRNSKPRLLDRSMTRILSTEAMLRRMEMEEERNISDYNNQSAIATDAESVGLFRQFEAEEKTHAKVIKGLFSPNSAQARLNTMMSREKWHVSTGSWIGDAIYGVNDGLGAVFGIVSGVAGYTGGGHAVVVAGVFGMLASALSMGSGAYLATKSEREVYEAEIGRERREIEDDPEHEREELELIYQLKGFSAEESARMAQKISEQPDQFLQTMAHEELGLAQKSFPNPLLAAGSSSLSTAIGAIVPVAPFFFTFGMKAIILSAVISTIAHFAVGAAKSIVTNRSWWASGTEMMLVGLLEAGITFGLGVAFGTH
ncbi:MAG: VIT1/CCC1 transporter family protein [Armatimonadetes bacterium]|nr:VIT1/CCC1 transporter family protein [Armatimonadota bacterium]